MSKNSLAKIVCLIFVLVMTGGTGVFAQDKSCGLKIAASGFEDETPISGATAVAVNTESKKVYKSVLSKGMPFFASLREGSYEITVSKTGYKKSIDEYVVACAGTENEVLTTSMPMWQGSSTETVAVSDYVQTGKPMGRYRPAETNDSEVLKAPPLTSVGKIETSENGDNTRIVNGIAVNLVKPAYPAAALKVNATGAVNVQVTIDEEGKVISAFAISGHPLLRAAAVKAAKESTFTPTTLEGQPVKVTGVIVYNFVP